MNKIEKLIALEIDLILAGLEVAQELNKIRNMVSMVGGELYIEKILYLCRTGKQYK